MTSSFFVHS